MADTGDVVYKANLNIEDILSGLVQVDKATQDTAKRIDAHFKQAGKSIKGLFVDANGRIREANGRFSSMGNAAAQGFKHAEGGAKNLGLQIGFTSGIVSSITTKFIELGHRMVQALSQGIKESVSLASNLETTQAIFTGIFQGNEEAAVGTLKRIRAESRELGVDLGETARAFLPFVESLDQLSKVSKISAALAISQPEQGALGARVALQEFLAGSSLSLVRRFEIPKNLGKELNEAIATGGVEEGLAKLEEILARMGRNIENLGDTAQLSFGKAAIAGQQLQTAFGQPILDELKTQFDELNTIVAENFDDYTLIADTFGRILAHIVEIVGSGLTDFLAGLDTEQVIEIAETLFDIVENARLFAQILSDTDTPVGLLDGIQAIAEGLNTALETAIKLSAIVKGELARQKAENEAAASLGPSAPRGTFGQINTALLGDEDRARIEAAGEAARNKVLTETVAALEASTKAKEDNRKATDDMAASLKENTHAGEDEADAFLADAEAARKLADAQEEATAAQAKIDEARAKAQKDYQQDLLEADIKFERARTDALLDGQRKREDAAKQNLQKIADIEKKNKQGRTDSETDLDRDIEDIHRKHSREKIEQRKDEAQKIIDLETDTRRKISDIIDRSQIDLDEAEQRRDAVSFLRILKARNLDIAEAQKDTARAVQDTRTEGERKRDELKIQQQQEIADARLANERRLEDLQTALSRELEAQATAYDREREQIATNEQRKLDDLVLARERDREDALRHYQEKLADLEISMAAELETIKKFHAMEEEEAKRHAQAMADAEAKAKKPSRTGGKAAGFGPNPGTITGHEGPEPSRRGGRAGGFGRNPGTIGRAYGGLVNAGGSYPVGERGPELFQPSANGRIIPNNALVMPSMVPKSIVNNISSNRQQAINLGVLDPDSVGMLNEAKMRNIVLGILAGL